MPQFPFIVQIFIQFPKNVIILGMNSPQTQEPAEQFICRFLKWVSKQGNSGILYRGLADKEWDVSSSLYRRLRDSKFIDEQSQTPAEIDQMLIEANTQITTRAKQPHHSKDGIPVNTLQTWTNMQHYGAATVLIDFTRNSLVALWFACQEAQGKETDGKVVALDSSDENKYKTISENDDEQLAKLFKDGFLWKWQPPKQNNRIISQHSEFVLGKHVIDTDDEFPILHEMKNPILAELGKNNISDEYFFVTFMVSCKSMHPTAPTLITHLITSLTPRRQRSQATIKKQLICIIRLLNTREMTKLYTMNAVLPKIN